MIWKNKRRKEEEYSRNIQSKMSENRVARFWKGNFDGVREMEENSQKRFCAWEIEREFCDLDRMTDCE